MIWKLINTVFRLAYKSSSKSAKRCLVPCLEARSAIVRARARSASEGEFDLFPLLEIESSDVILARTLQGAKSSQGVNYFIISFPVSYNGSKAMLFLRSHGVENHANQAFYHVSPVPENISLQCGGVYRERCLTKKVIFRID